MSASRLVSAGHRLMHRCGVGRARVWCIAVGWAGHASAGASERERRISSGRAHGRGLRTCRSTTQKTSCLFSSSSSVFASFLRRGSGAEPGAGGGRGGSGVRWTTKARPARRENRVRVSRGGQSPPSPHPAPPPMRARARARSSCGQSASISASTVSAQARTFFFLLLFFFLSCPGNGTAYISHTKRHGFHNPAPPTRVRVGLPCGMPCNTGHDMRHWRSQLPDRHKGRVPS